MALLGMAQGTVPVHVAEATHADSGPCDPFVGLAALPSCVACAWEGGIVGACEGLRASAPRAPRLVLQWR